jgi:hypothetical protein
MYGQYDVWTAFIGPPGPFDRINTSKIGKIQKIPAASHALSAKPVFMFVRLNFVTSFIIY